MSNIRVKGFNSITFWQEDSIGLIVIKSDRNGNIQTNTLNELMQSLAVAAADEKVKYIGITGINSVFAKDIYFKPEESVKEALETMLSYSLFSSGVQKPIISLLNGDAINIGYEIALLSDLIVSTSKAQCGFTKDYQCLMGGTIARRRFSNPTLSKSTERKNCDKLIEEIDFLGIAKEFILKEVRNNIYQERNAFRWDLKERIYEEQINFLKVHSDKIKKDDHQANQI